MLVDTGAWYALADRSDRHHKRARGFYLEEAPKGRLVTTDLIVAEGWSLIAAHLGRPAAVTFWETLRTTRISILPLDAVDLEAAWRILQAFPDQTFSFTDCTSFALMERIGVHEAFAFDSHFLVYRFGARRDRVFRRWPT
jgi:predicted nucleic acid-binding protein